MKKLTKLFSIVLVIAMLVMCMAGCGDKKETAGSDQNPTAGGDASTLYLGGIGPLTGDYANYGTSTKNGAMLAAEEINAAGGVNGMTLKVDYQDSVGDPESAVNAYGKLIDSAIIGVLCFILMSLFKMPFALLISVVVGVTNIIPFFGPLIGAIPCAILVLFYSPIKCIYFVIFVFALQQFDGNILGPKILGDSTGISSFGVLFSIIFFGGIFGFVGMLIGVPLFAVISSLIGGLVQGRLSKKKMSIDSEDYTNLAKVSEKPDGFAYEKMKDPTHK